jgi:hypothetical protein
MEDFESIFGDDSDSDDSILNENHDINISEIPVIDVTTKQIFDKLKYIGEYGRVDPREESYFGMVRYHNKPPAPPVVITKTHGELPKTGILGISAKNNQAIRDGLKQLSNDIGDNIRKFHIGLYNINKAKFKNIYPGESVEEDEILCYLYILEVSKIERNVKILGKTMKDYFKMNTTSIQKHGPNNSGDIGWYEKALLNTPNFEPGSERPSNRDRPAIFHDNITEISGHCDPLFDFGVKHVRSWGSGYGTTSLVYACCFQHMQSLGCIIGYPELKKQEDPTYKWYGGFEPNKITAHYRGVAFKDTLKFDLLYSKIKEVLLKYSDKLDSFENIEKLKDEDLRELCYVAEWMYQYNLDFRPTSRRDFPRPEEIPEKRQEMIDYLKRNIKTKEIVKKEQKVVEQQRELQKEEAKKEGLQIIDQNFWKVIIDPKVSFADQLAKYKLDDAAKDFYDELRKLYFISGDDDKKANLKSMFENELKNPVFSLDVIKELEKQQLKKSWKDIFDNANENLLEKKMTSSNVTYFYRDFYRKLFKEYNDKIIDPNKKSWFVKILQEMENDPNNQKMFQTLYDQKDSVYVDKTWDFTTTILNLKNGASSSDYKDYLEKIRLLYVKYASLNNKNFEIPSEEKYKKNDKKYNSDIALIEINYISETLKNFWNQTDNESLEQSWKLYTNFHNSAFTYQIKTIDLKVFKTLKETDFNLNLEKTLLYIKDENKNDIEKIINILKFSISDFKNFTEGFKNLDFEKIKFVFEEYEKNLANLKKEKEKNDPKKQEQEQEYKEEFNNKIEAFKITPDSNTFGKIIEIFKKKTITLNENKEEDKNLVEELLKYDMLKSYTIDFNQKYTLSWKKYLQIYKDGDNLMKVSDTVYITENDLNSFVQLILKYFNKN